MVVFDKKGGLDYPITHISFEPYRSESYSLHRKLNHT